MCALVLPSNIILDYIQFIPEEFSLHCARQCAINSISEQCRATRRVFKSLSLSVSAISILAMRANTTRNINSTCDIIVYTYNMM